MAREIVQTESGMFSLFMDNGSNHLLPLIVNRQIEWVWVLGHRPNRYVEWWGTRLPLSKTGSPHAVRARDVAFDLVFRTEEFLELHTEFLRHGIVLYQSTKPMPDTLILGGIEERAMDQVLRQNGVYLHFFLPHPHETCQVKCWDRSHLEKIQAGRSAGMDGEDAAADAGR